MAITTERKRELIAAYEEIKKRISEIDAKYSTEYQIVELDFPPTLGLEKLTYTMSDDNQLAALAEKEVAPKYVEKLRALERSFNTSKTNVNAALDSLAEKHRAKLAVLFEEYGKSQVGLLEKLINNGLLYSSVKNNAESAALADYNKKISEQNTVYQAECAVYSDKLTALTNNYNASITSLNAQKTAEINAVKQDIHEKENAEALQVVKYNQSVDEKEAKYKASCERYRRYAQQAENERALAAAKLFAELGESGVELQKKTEKFNFCKSEFNNYRREEGQFMLSLDGFLQTHLGDYYSSLEDWVNTVLIP